MQERIKMGRKCCTLRKGKGVTAEEEIKIKEYGQEAERLNEFKY